MMNMIVAPMHRLLLLLAIVLCSFNVSSKSVWKQPFLNTLRVGVAKINITPATPILMSGYGSRDQPFQGVHDSLYAYALVFDDGIQQAVLLTADLIGMSHSFVSETTEMIVNETGIDPSNILLNATHNHGGPVNNTYGMDEHPAVIEYVSFLQKQILSAVKRAFDNRISARIGAGMGTCNMNINRRARFADGNIWLGRNPDGPCDRTVGVVRIDNLSQKPMAVLINWACHGTTSGQDNYQITGDWPGAASRFVENALGPPSIAPVTAGASADINPIYGPNDRFQDIDAIGMLLGEEVLRVAEQVTTSPTGLIAGVKQTVLAPGRKPSNNRFPNQELAPADPVEINLSVLRIGSVLFAGISGEVMTEIGMKIKKESAYPNTLVVTHCNGSSGYLLTDEAYKEGGYEAMVTKTMPGTADLITTTLREMINSLP